MIEGPVTNPIATQVIAVRTRHTDKESVPEGGVWAVQVEPSVVSTILVPPTAVHSSIVKHEMD